MTPPALPAALTSRPMRLDDAERWAQLCAAAEEADRRGERYSAADLAEELSEPDLDLDRDTLLVLDGDLAVAYQVLRRHGNARLHADAVVHPEYRRRGIGAALMAEARQRAELDAVVNLRVPEQVAVAVALMERAGLVPIRWWSQLYRDLAGPVDPAPLASGLTLHPLGPGYPASRHVGAYELRRGARLRAAPHGYRDGVPPPPSAAEHPLAWLEPHAARRRAAGLRRELRPRSAAEPLIDLAGNDYLGLSADPRVVQGAVDAVRAWGAGSTGSRLVTGTTALHAELERELAAFCGAEAALVFSSGYAANLGVLTALSGPGTLIVSDAANHASLVDACRLSRARIAVVPRDDVAAVDAALAARAEPRALVVTDAVNSVDGGLAPLASLHAVCRARGALLVVDDAHGLGVCGPGGRGLLAGVGLAGADDVVATVTLSKALGSQGGAVLGPAAVIAHLVDTARSFIFDTGLAPACVGAALAALRVLRDEPWLPGRVLEVAAALAGAAGVPAPPSAVVSVVLGEPAVAFVAAARCADHGLRVGCFRPPSVPEGTSRLRLTARATLTDADLAQVRAVLSEVLSLADHGRMVVR